MKRNQHYWQHRAYRVRQELSMSIRRQQGMLKFIHWIPDARPWDVNVRGHVVELAVQEVDMSYWQRQLSARGLRDLQTNGGNRVYYRDDNHDFAVALMPNGR